MKNILFTLLTLVISSVAGLLGFVLTPESAPAVFNFLALLDPRLQVGIFVVLALLILVPITAPYTPWTWDDRTIRFQQPVMQIIGRIWNVLASNFGKASNKDSGW